MCGMTQSRRGFAALYSFRLGAAVQQRGKGKTVAVGKNFQETASDTPMHRKAIQIEESWWRAVFHEQLYLSFVTRAVSRCLPNPANTSAVQQNLCVLDILRQAILEN